MQYTHALSRHCACGTKVMCSVKENNRGPGGKPRPFTCQADIADNNAIIKIISIITRIHRARSPGIAPGNDNNN